jgi:general secretion pathway protein G
MRFATISVMVAVCMSSCSESPAPDDFRTRPEYQMSFIVVALDTFKEDCGRYPSSVEGLTVLLKRPSGFSETQWRGPYLKSTSIPIDKWGHSYFYHCPSINSTNKYELYSRGPDGVSKSDGHDADDINYWTMKKILKL